MIDNFSGGVRKDGENGSGMCSHARQPDEMPDIRH